MALKKALPTLTPIDSNNGASTEPGSSIKTDGFTTGMRPAAQWHNWLFQKIWLWEKTLLSLIRTFVTNWKEGNRVTASRYASFRDAHTCSNGKTVVTGNWVAGVNAGRDFLIIGRDFEDFFTTAEADVGLTSAHSANQSCMADDGTTFALASTSSIQRVALTALDTSFAFTTENVTGTSTDNCVGVHYSSRLSLAFAVIQNPRTLYSAASFSSGSWTSRIALMHNSTDITAADFAESPTAICVLSRAAATEGYIYRSTNGTSWTDVTPVSSPLATVHGGLIYDAFNGIFWAAINDNKLHKSTNDGVSWSAATPGELTTGNIYQIGTDGYGTIALLVNGANANADFTERGVILFSTDAGATWQFTALPSADKPGDSPLAWFLRGEKGMWVAAGGAANDFRVWVTPGIQEL